MTLTKTQLFNDVLTELGLRTVDDTGEAIESNRVLHNAYTRTVEFCLESGQWNFATRTVKATSDTGIEPAFGYKEVFAKPTDWMRTIGMSADEYNSIPLVDSQYKDENEVWLTDVSPVYVRYISNDTGYGMELNKWPPSFTRYVTLELASRVCERLTQNASKLEEIKRDLRFAKRNALNKDAMNQGSQTMKSGRLVSVRSGNFDNRERGSRSNFTG